MTEQPVGAPQTGDRLAEIEARLEKATPGPWGLYTQGRIVEVTRKPGSRGKPVVPWSGFDESDVPLAVHQANARLIAHAPGDLRYLLDLVARLRSSPPEEQKVWVLEPPSVPKEEEKP